MSYKELLDGNRAWSLARRREDPTFFERQAREHKPRFLYIGCVDARVPAELITGVEPGDLFVHRNIANQVLPTCSNVQAVLEYGINALGVQDVIVCGHEGCGGVRAALETQATSHLESWLANIRNVARLHRDEIAACENMDDRARRLVELNVTEQVRHLATSPVVQQAWARGATLRLHGWVYQIGNGLIRDLGMTMEGPAEAFDMIAAQDDLLLPVGMTAARAERGEAQSAA